MERSLIGSVGSVLLALVGFILIVYLAYFATKKIGRRMSVKGIGGRNIKILDSISIGKDNAVMIIEAAEKILLIGITPGGISLISELDGENIVKDDEVQSGPMDFSRAFKTALEQKLGKKFPGSKENKDDDGKGQQ